MGFSTYGNAADTHRLYTVRFQQQQRRVGVVSMTTNDPNDFWWQWPMLAVIGIVAGYYLIKTLVEE
jgi:hypothetical protein